MSAALLYGVKNKGGVLVLAFELMSAKFQSVTWQSVATPLLLPEIHVPDICLVSCRTILYTSV